MGQIFVSALGGANGGQYVSPSAVQYGDTPANDPLGHPQITGTGYFTTPTNVNNNVVLTVPAECILEGKQFTVRASGWVYVAGVSPTIQVTLAQAAIPGSGPVVNPNLGAAAEYAILAYSGITNTGTNVITGGNIGSSSTPATLVGLTLIPPSVIDNANATAARTAGVAAYNYYTSLSFTSISATSVDLSTYGSPAGNVWAPGNYQAGTSISMSAGVVLNGPAGSTWVFWAGSTINIASGQSITFEGGATAANSTVIWLAGSSFSQSGTGGTFVGTILANTSITFAGTETVIGRLLAIGSGNGDVTLAAGGSVTVPGATGGSVAILPSSAASLTTAHFYPWALAAEFQGDSISKICQVRSSLMLDGVLTASAAGTNLSPIVFGVVPTAANPAPAQAGAFQLVVGLNFGVANTANLAQLDQFSLEA